MKRKVKKQVKIAMIAILILISLFIAYKLSTKPKLLIKENGIHIVSNKKYKSEVYGGENYITIPINEDMSKFKVEIYNDEGIQLNDKQINQSFRELDTLIPGERNLTFKIDGKDITMHIIIE